MCVCVCVLPFILDIKFVGHTSRGHTGGRSHSIMQEGVFITSQEAMEPILNETLICDRSKPSLKALKSSLAFHNS